VTLRLELVLEGVVEAGVDADALHDLIERVLEAEGVEGRAAAGLELVDEERIRELNRTHRGRDTVTDVLSFPIDGLDRLPPGLQRQLGDVMICPAQARRQAAEAGVEPGDELRSLVVHGTLHLLGYDHERDTGEMLARQDALCAEAPALRWDGT
jgi:probable rRNA maturation factor